MKKLILIIIAIFVLFVSISVLLNSKKNIKDEASQLKSAMEKVKEEIMGEPDAVSPEGWGDAPDFNIKDLNGDNLRLSDLKGKVIILDFWATWCPPCRAEIPAFNELYSEYKDQGLEIIGLSLDRDGPPVVKKFAKEYNIKYILAMGNDKIVNSYRGIVGIPTTFIIDRDGNIRGQHVGFAPKEVFEEEIKNLL
jgi:peroxiredoxin